MKKEEKYQLLIRSLQKNRPVPDNKAEMTENIIRAIRVPKSKGEIQKRLMSYAFGWVNIYWMRGTMAVFAILFIGFFISQQLSIANRLNSLEDQLQKTLSSKDKHEPELQIMQTVLINKLRAADDSITVSRSDLEDLLNSYLEIQDENSRGSNRPKPDIHKKLKPILKNSSKGNDV